MNAGKSKIMVFERKGVCDFSLPYRVCWSVAGRCEIILYGEKMEELKEFKHLGMVLTQ